MNTKLKKLLRNLCLISTAIIVAGSIFVAVTICIHYVPKYRFDIEGYVLGAYFLMMGTYVCLAPLQLRSWLAQES